MSTQRGRHSFWLVWTLWGLFTWNVEVWVWHLRDLVLRLILTSGVLECRVWGVTGMYWQLCLDLYTLNCRHSHVTVTVIDLMPTPLAGFTVVSPDDRLCLALLLRYFCQSNMYAQCVIYTSGIFASFLNYFPYFLDKKSYIKTTFIQHREEFLCAE